MFTKWSMEELGRMSAEEFQHAEKIPVVVVLDQVRSMNNVGSVFRTADAFLINKIYLCGYTPYPPHRDIQKTALGATETVEWQHEPSTALLIERLKKEGYQIVAIEQAKGSQPLHNWKWEGKKPLALILGNEVEGVQDSVLTQCDSCIEIPQSGMKHSLNISVAAGIILWEAFRRSGLSSQANGG